TRAAYKVSDDQMAALRKDLGEPKLVAFVQLVAFGNFQDRLLLTLDVPPESGGPLPSAGVRFTRPWVGGAAAACASAPQAGGGPPSPMPGRCPRSRGRLRMRMWPSSSGRSARSGPLTSFGGPAGATT